jgi:hypothetical protein
VKSPSESARAALALALLVPAPSLGALAAFVIAPGPLGQAIYAACKLWLVALPLVWHARVERRRLAWPRWPRERRREALADGLALAWIFVAAVLAANAALGAEIVDAERLQLAATEAGFGTPARYLALAAYLALANSAVEELVWRAFVLRQCERVVSPRAAIPLSAALFALHHAIAFTAELGPLAGALATLAVFAAGCVWSWCYARYRSIWPGWISHVAADAAGLAIGWTLIFG